MVPCLSRVLYALSKELFLLAPSLTLFEESGHLCICACASIYFSSQLAICKFSCCYVYVILARLYAVIMRELLGMLI